MSIARGIVADEQAIRGRRADPAAKRLRRLIMHQMHRSGSTIGEIARHYRYTERHVMRELAEFRRSQGLGDGS